MKKIILIILIGCLLLMLTSCASKKGDNMYGDKFILISDDIGGGTFLMYDSDTKLVYIFIKELYMGALSPYYIVDNGVQRIAVYPDDFE